MSLSGNMFANFGSRVGSILELKPHPKTRLKIRRASGPWRVRTKWQKILPPLVLRDTLKGYPWGGSDPPNLAGSTSREAFGRVSKIDAVLDPDFGSKSESKCVPKSLKIWQKSDPESRHGLDDFLERFWQPSTLKIKQKQWKGRRNQQFRAFRFYVDFGLIFVRFGLQNVFFWAPKTCPR